MGRLLKLELENFKSYAGKQIVGPFDNFTCIVGPNGSGKSNMMDAISFVLGCNSRHLRSLNLKELIHRKSADDAPARRTSVSLFYVVDDGEVSGFDAGSEIKFTRTVSSSGVSNYKLDEKDVTFEVYEKILKQIGVLVKARNFLVFQGDVEAVASKSPQEISKLIEQISGSEDFKAEYDELKVRNEEESESMTVLIGKKKMYMGQCKELKSQKDEAEFYQSKQEEARKLKTELTLLQVWKTTLVIEENQRSVSKFKTLLDEVSNREGTLEDEIQLAKKDQARRNKTQSGTEKELTAKAKLIEALVLELNGCDAKIKSFKKRIQEGADGEARMKADVKQQSSNKRKFEEQIATLQSEAAEIESELNKKTAGSAGLLLDPENLKEYSRLREVVSARTGTWRSEELNLEQDLTSKEQRVSRLESQIRTIRQEAESEVKLIKDYEDRQGRLTKSISDGKKELAQINAERSSVIEEAKANGVKTEAYTLELEGINTKISEAGDEIRRNIYEDKMNEAITSMKRIFPGVHGKLLDVCRPIQRKYSIALQVAAGKSMDCIIVDSKQVAMDCMAYLRDQRIGVCTFLPLNNLTLTPISDRYRTFGENYKLCIDLIQCDDIFKPAVQYAIGDTIVCETLEQAQALCFRSVQEKGTYIKAVTVKGHVISKTGSMTGGSQSSNYGGSETRNRWDEKEFEKMRQRKTELEGLLSVVKQSVQSRQAHIDLETKYKTLQSRIQYSEADAKVALEKLNLLRQQKDLKADSIKSIESDITQLKKDISLINANLSKIKDSIRAVENDVFSDFSSTVGVVNIREYEESKVKVHDALLKRRILVSEQLSALNSQLEYENKRDFEGPIQRIKAQISELEGSIKEQKSIEASSRKSEDALRKEVAEITKKLEKNKLETSEINAAFKVLQGKKSKLKVERDSIMSSISGEEILIEKSRSELHQTLQKAQVDEVTLPTVSVSIRNPSSSPSISSIETSQMVDVNESDLIWTGAQSSESEISRDTSQRRISGRRAASSSSAGGGVGVGGLDEIDSSEEVSDTTGTGGTGTSRSATTIHYSQSGDSAVVRDRIQVAKVDLASMAKYKSYTSSRIDEIESKYTSDITKIHQDLENLNPNMHAFERYAHLVDISNECESKVEEARQTSRTVAIRFEQVKRFRCDAFMECYRHISEALAIVYRDLTRSSKHPLGGNAYLTLDNTDEPYLGGTRFTAMPPMKRFRDIEQLSGGEKTMAALALLFSIHSFRQAPFFVLDEVDAALDNVNVKKVCNYIQQRSKDFQCIVISLKDMFFEHADCLIGICKDVPSLSGRIISLNLKQYIAENAASQQAGGDLPHQRQLSSSSSLQRSTTNNLQADDNDDEYSHQRDNEEGRERERGRTSIVPSGTGVMSVDPEELIMPKEVESVKKVYKMTTMPPPALPSAGKTKSGKSGGAPTVLKAQAASSSSSSSSLSSSSSSFSSPNAAGDTKSSSLATTTEQPTVRRSARQSTAAASGEGKKFSQ